MVVAAETLQDQDSIAGATFVSEKKAIVKDPSLTSMPIVTADKRAQNQEKSHSSQETVLNLNGSSSRS